MNEKRIAIIGGLPESLINFRWPLIQAMAARECKLYGYAAGSNAEVSKKFTELGGHYSSIHLSRAGLNPIQDLRTFLVLYKELKSIAPQVVIAYTIKPVIYGMIAARLAGVPYRYALITGLGYAFTNGSASRQRSSIRKIAVNLYKFSLKKSTHIFFQNPDDKKTFEDLKILDDQQAASIVNGSGVDIHHFSPTPLPPQPIFLLIARLLKDKGIREYVAAASEIKKTHPHVIFRLAGPIDPNPSAITKDELHQWTQSNIIEYLGSLEDVRPAISNSSCYVLPSYREGTPRTVLEAMAMGRPIITTDAPGCRETVQHNVNGLLVPPQDIPALVKAMKLLLASSKLRAEMGSNSREIAVKKYDSAHVADSMVKKMAETASLFT